MKWLFCLWAMSLNAAWLEWDASTYPVRIYYGTNAYLSSYDAGYTNMIWLARLKLQPQSTYCFNAVFYGPDGESEFSEDVWFTTPAGNNSAPRTNVVLRVPAGKYYVERGGLTTWAPLYTVTGPTNVVLPITGSAMEFIRYRAFFVSATRFKDGKLAKAAPMVRAQPVLKVSNAAPPPLPPLP